MRGRRKRRRPGSGQVRSEDLRRSRGCSGGLRGRPAPGGRHVRPPARDRAQSSHRCFLRGGRGGGRGHPSPAVSLLRNTQQIKGMPPSDWWKPGPHPTPSPVAPGSTAYKHRATLFPLFSLSSRATETPAR
uniref:Uncharacterized protein n=1 Tax=Rousettus aegyptiacus TaxID=9407 RepID=A0A7J8CHQ0_ROUAE|nr:hypothetical protein HJG63_008974 [Rousettus aegyptiacus]